MLFGHGPVFRDLNFALDPDAAAQVLAMRLPISLVPYDAARGIELTAEDLDRLGNSLPWIVERSRGWLDYWRTAIGRSGFYPFDLIAAAYVVEPSWLRCTPVRAWVGGDDTLFLPWAPEALLVEPDARGAVLYCGLTRGEMKQRVMAFFN
jgi:purine nucleosidase